MTTIEKLYYGNIAPHEKHAYQTGRIMSRIAFGAKKIVGSGVKSHLMYSLSDIISTRPRKRAEYDFRRVLYAVGRNLTQNGWGSHR